MKHVNELKKLMLYVGVIFLVMGFTSCSDDDDGDVIVNPEPTGTITVDDDGQVISQNTLIVDQVTANTDVWLVARHTDASGEIIARELLTEDINTNVELSLEGTTLNDGDTVFLMLYTDDGFGIGDGQFEEGTDDMPISGATETVVVSSPDFSISDATVTNNSIIFDNVTVADTGWIVVYNGNPNDATSEIVGFTQVTGSTDNVTVEFNENYTEGDPLFARLHVEDQDDDIFTFIDDQTTDVPEIFGFELDNTIWQDLTPANTI